MPTTTPTETPKEQPNRPTRKQLAYLRKLASERGQTFTYPRTSTEASAEIRRLRGQTRSTRSERAIETKAVRAGVQNMGDDARPTTYDTEGYGAAATWKDTWT